MADKTTTTPAGLGLLAAAVIQVMNEVDGIEKTKKVGTGTNAYMGVEDKEVKKVVGAAMAKAGLVLLPIGCEGSSSIQRWTESNAQYGDKAKKEVFVEVKTRYLLLHTSGQSIELEGYGQGIDSQDKAAGKALKYTLLYTFLVPTGKIDDADNNHGSELPTAPPVTTQAPPPPPQQVTQKQIVQQTSESVTEEELSHVLKALLLCSTVPELVELKKQLRPAIITDKQFETAATDRYNQITKPATTPLPTPF
jgi:hypothetical protein